MSFAEVLLEKGLITPGQLAEAMDLRKKEGIRLDRGLVQLGYVAEESLLQVMGEQLAIPEDQITPQKSFEADLGADSIGLVELMMQFEDKFEMSIPDEEAESIKTVGDAIKYIEEHQ